MFKWQIGLFTLSLFVATLWAQTGINSKNLNPDPTGAPWYVDNYQLPASRNIIPDQEIHRTLQLLAQQGDTLPYKVSHIHSKYMRPIFNQSGGSCGAASQICYMFAYEINNYRNVPGNVPMNIYPSHFTFMTADRNSSQAEMAIFNGIPNSIFYGGDTYSKIYGREVGSPDDDKEYGWMNGYGAWFNAMNNKLQYNDFINIDSPEKLDYLKHWIYDHLGDHSFHEGGVAGTGLAISGSKLRLIPSGEYAAHKYILYDWGPKFDHAMTWAGYDDSVGYDFNKDGKITNNIDITGDGKVDMLDWERGAMITLNSWGDQWANGGWVYIPYRILKKYKMNAEFYHIRKNYKPKLVMKIKMQYNQRNRIKLKIGIAQKPNADKPERTMLCHHFLYQGRTEIDLLGRWADGTVHTEPMEFELDLTDLTFGYDLTKPYTVFLEAITQRYPGGGGKIHSLSVVDYFGDQANEVTATITDSSLLKGKIYYFPITMPANPNAPVPQYVYANQKKFSIRYYDSQETSAEYAPAKYAIDGNVKTIWHTKYSGGDDPYPHELQIDLGDTVDVACVEYTPRPDGPHGRIADYEIYVSNDYNHWGAPVAKGTWRNTSVREYAYFTAKKGRYLRLRALSEVDGNPWASAAEINVLKPYQVTGIEHKNLIAEKFKLEQNFPNPFNPTTVISYYLPLTTNVTLTVYNVLGQKIKKLVQRKESAGWHKVQFNAEGLPSGIYFYRLHTANGFESQRKMILLH